MPFTFRSLKSGTLVALVAGALFLGCGGSGSQRGRGDACLATTECETDLVCFENTCTVECATDGQCDFGEGCATASGDSGCLSECTAEADCNIFQQCDADVALCIAD